MTKLDRQLGTRVGEGDEDSDLVALAQALSHPLRLAIVRMIAPGFGSAARVADELRLPLNGVSYHVRILERLGMLELVETRRHRGGLERV